MKYKVEILPSAWEDLKTIEDWYVINFDVQTAIKVSDHILDGIERLEEFPDSGSRTPDEWLNEQGYRMVISGKHVSIYRVIKIRYTFIISQIRKQNIQNCLSKEDLLSFYQKILFLILRII